VPEDKRAPKGNTESKKEEVKTPTQEVKEGSQKNTSENKVDDRVDNKSSQQNWGDNKTSQQNWGENKSQNWGDNKSQNWGGSQGNPRKQPRNNQSRRNNRSFVDFDSPQQFPPLSGEIVPESQPIKWGPPGQNN